MSLPPVTVCCTYFKSLGLDNLRAALYSLRKQAFIDTWARLVVVDNDTPDSQPDIQACINELQFPVPVDLLSYKHGDGSRTHSWSTNTAIRAAKTNWIFYTRADYLLDFGCVLQHQQMTVQRTKGWTGFVTSDCYQLQAGIDEVERTRWRDDPQHLQQLAGVAVKHSVVDSGVFMLTRAAFEQVGGLEEGLTQWGHAQTHFQWKLHRAGVEIVRLPKLLYYHPMHGGPRDLPAATAQLMEVTGVDIKEIWKNYDGSHIYK